MKKSSLLPVVGIVVTVILTRNFFREVRILSVTHLMETEQNHNTKLADGCYHVFMDVGANIGVHGRFLYEPHKYPIAKTSREIFDREFGAKRDNRDFCVFAFEPNPRHHPKIQAKADAYQAMGWRYQLVPVGVGDEDSVLAFYRQGDDRNEEWGFNAMPSTSKRNGKVAVNVSVPVVRLSTWISENVEGRRLPDRPYGNYTDIRDKNGKVGGPKIAMKMDIEAMEFRVLPDLLYSGILCRAVDFTFG